MKGSLKIIVKDVETGVEEIREGNNIIVKNASKLMAELMRGVSFTDPLRVQVPGILTLAVGTGGLGWTLQSPPIATSDQEQLETEIFRKQFDSVNYIDTLGNITPTRTNIIDLTTVFSVSEANDALVEMGLFGGDGATSTGGGTMINYYTFPVINKNNSVMSIIWRISF